MSFRQKNRGAGVKPSSDLSTKVDVVAAAAAVRRRLMVSTEIVFD